MTAYDPRSPFYLSPLLTFAIITVIVSVTVKAVM